MEYGLLIATVAAVVSAVVFSLGRVVSEEFDTHASCLASQMSSQTC